MCSRSHSSWIQVWRRRQDMGLGLPWLFRLHTRSQYEHAWRKGAEYIAVEWNSTTHCVYRSNRIEISRSMFPRRSKRCRTTHGHDACDTRMKGSINHEPHRVSYANTILLRFAYSLTPSWCHMASQSRMFDVFLFVTLFVHTRIHPIDAWSFYVAWGISNQYETRNEWMYKHTFKTFWNSSSIFSIALYTTHQFYVH